MEDDNYLRTIVQRGLYRDIESMAKAKGYRVISDPTESGWYIILTRPDVQYILKSSPCGISVTRQEQVNSSWTEKMRKSYALSQTCAVKAAIDLLRAIVRRG